MTRISYVPESGPWREILMDADWTIFLPKPGGQPIVVPTQGLIAELERLSLM